MESNEIKIAIVTSLRDDVTESSWQGRVVNSNDKRGHTELWLAV